MTDYSESDTETSESEPEICYSCEVPNYACECYD